ISIVGATRADTNTLVYVAAVWWCVAVLVGLWLGRRAPAHHGGRHTLRRGGVVVRRGAGGTVARAPATADRGDRPPARRGALDQLAARARAGRHHVQPALACRGRDRARRGRRVLLCPGAGGGDWVLHPRGAALAAPVECGGGDRGTRRRAVLVRPHLAVRAAAAASAARPAPDR